MGPNILDYYRERDGNPSGIPVEIMSINLESGADAETQAFIDRYGLELVVNDYQRVPWNQYGEGYIPHFVIVTGAAPTNYGQWEILYSDYGYPGHNQFRSIIDGVVLIPEPGTLWLLAIGGLVFVLWKRRR